MNKQDAKSVAIEIANKTLPNQSDVMVIMLLNHEYDKVRDKILDMRKSLTELDKAMQDIKR